MRLANERWCYIVTSSLIGWVHTLSSLNIPWPLITSTHLCTVVYSFWPNSAIHFYVQVFVLLTEELDLRRNKKRWQIFPIRVLLMYWRYDTVNFLQISCICLFEVISMFIAMLYWMPLLQVMSCYYIARPILYLFLNQYWIIFNWDPYRQSSVGLESQYKTFLHRNAFQNVLCNILTILSMNRSGHQFAHATTLSCCGMCKLVTWLHY